MGQISGFDGREKKTQTSVQGCQTDKTGSESVHLHSQSVHLAKLMPNVYRLFPMAKCTGNVDTCK